MARKSYACAQCDHIADRCTDLSLHIYRVHGIAYRETYQPTVMPRDVSCWGCAQPISPSETLCSCGRPKPDYYTPHLLCDTLTLELETITTTEGKP